jgi:ABC-type cobalamin/Fe3+-siderophores transport system ATPase subunit
MLIACSLAQEPALLLDEPAGQCEPANQLAVIRLPKKLRGMGIPAANLRRVLGVPFRVK